MRKKNAQPLALIFFGLVLVGCSSSVEVPTISERWRLISKFNENAFLLGAEGQAQGRIEIWVDEELSIFEGAAANATTCPTAPQYANSVEVDLVVDQLPNPNWIEEAEIETLGLRFARMAHQCASEFPSEEYWFDSLNDALLFAERSKIRSFQYSEWVPIFNHSEFERYARLEGFGSGMGWSLATNPSSYSGAYVSFHLADCKTETLVDAIDLHLSAQGMTGEISRSPLRLRAPLLEQGDAELLGWLCGAMDPASGLTSTN